MMRPMMSAFLAGALCLAAAAPALAGPDEVIKYRKGVMESLGAGMTGIFGTLKGDLDQKANFKDITAMMAISARLARNTFQVNTIGQGKERTSAKDSIWSNYADFTKKMDAMVVATAKLAQVTAKTPNDMKAITAAASAVGGTCKACHEEYEK